MITISENVLLWILGFVVSALGVTFITLFYHVKECGSIRGKINTSLAVLTERLKNLETMLKVVLDKRT